MFTFGLELHTPHLAPLLPLSSNALLYSAVAIPTKITELCLAIFEKPTMQSYTWFFSLAQPVAEERQTQLQADFDRFTAQWQSHGTPVQGLITLRYGRFVVIQANPEVARPSGCSIDSLKRGVESILNHHQLAWLDPAWIFYRQGEDQIESVRFTQIPELIQAGTLNADSIVFDHSLNQSDGLSRWELPLQETWLRRYLATKKQA